MALEDSWRPHASISKSSFTISILYSEILLISWEKTAEKPSFSPLLSLKTNLHLLPFFLHKTPLFSWFLFFHSWKSPLHSLKLIFKLYRNPQIHLHCIIVFNRIVFFKSLLLFCSPWSPFLPIHFPTVDLILRSMVRAASHRNSPSGAFVCSPRSPISRFNICRRFLWV